MQKQKISRFTPRQIGIGFLIPGLALLAFDRFSSALMGFYVFAIVFGGIMLFMPPKPPQ